MVNVFTSNWWALVLRGLVALLFGLLTFVWPEISLTALVFLFGAYGLADGLFTAVLALRSPEGYRRGRFRLIPRFQRPFNSPRNRLPNDSESCPTIGA